MTKKKTTVYLDADLLRAAKVRAAREDKAEYEVIEDALRRHLGAEVLERIGSRADLDDEAATRLADEEVHQYRKRAKTRR